jgi:hypothetical protein
MELRGVRCAHRGVRDGSKAGRGDAASRVSWSCAECAALTVACATGGDRAVDSVHRTRTASAERRPLSRRLARSIV